MILELALQLEWTDCILLFYGWCILDSEIIAHVRFLRMQGLGIMSWLRADLFSISGFVSSHSEMLLPAA